MSPSAGKPGDDEKMTKAVVITVPRTWVHLIETATKKPIDEVINNMLRQMCETLVTEYARMQAEQEQAEEETEVPL